MQSGLCSSCGEELSPIDFHCEGACTGEIVRYLHKHISVNDFLKLTHFFPSLLLVVFKLSVEHVRNRGGPGSVALALPQVLCPKKLLVFYGFSK